MKKQNLNDFNIKLSLKFPVIMKNNLLKLIQPTLRQLMALDQLSEVYDLKQKAC